ncbi:MAG: hypothetical protein DI639_05350 [Leifsonia xyli]|nr:MAG: hypothetical protein DI639_05350 [Leifsonia xyli]
MRTRVASPGDPYLNRVGELAYAVTSLEGTLIFDIPRLASTIPAGTLDVAALQGESAGTIARLFREAAIVVTDERTRKYFAQGGRSLNEVATLRNDVLHARPATVSGKQRLHRTRKSGASFPIDDAWLDAALDAVQVELDAVNAVRPSFADFPA